MEKKITIVILIIIANFLGFFIIFRNYNIEIEQEKVKTFNFESEYIGMLEIPNLNIKNIFYDISSDKNTVALNVELIRGSSMPDEEKGNLILAAHRGKSKVAYFNNLDKITSDDEIRVYYQNKIYVYKYRNRYDVKKTGRVRVIRDADKTTITLISCKKSSNLQTVYIGYLVDIISL